MHTEMPLPPMAKKRVTAKTESVKRVDVTTRMSPDVLRLARTAAAWRNMSLVDYLNEIVTERAESDIASIPKPKGKGQN